MQESSIEVMNHSSRFESLVDGQISCDGFVAELWYGFGRQFWVATQSRVNIAMPPPRPRPLASNIDLFTWLDHHRLYRASDDNYAQRALGFLHLRIILSYLAHSPSLTGQNLRAANVFLILAKAKGLNMLTFDVIAVLLGMCTATASFAYLSQKVYRIPAIQFAAPPLKHGETTFLLRTDARDLRHKPMNILGAKPTQGFGYGSKRHNLQTW
ncbi:hypothetical protein BKA63DRAFT_495509 [Paraphoma chrysanthemicola]|nr:hypothetical protein BKA63DRAFT_495509 [Paraphoma chrysanthemicola]